MIGMLRGKVEAVGDDTLLIDVGGVGYEAYGAPRLLQRYGVGDAVTLSIETIVREDLIRLYGFENDAERQCFRMLQSVQGVGAKHALSILQIMLPAELYDVIAAEDVTALSRAHGVGKKIAQRIASELQSKIGALASASAPIVPLAGRNKVSSIAPNPGASARADAVSALANLGYDGVEARRAVALAAESGDDNPDVEELIKRALRELVPA